MLKFDSQQYRIPSFHNLELSIFWEGIICCHYQKFLLYGLNLPPCWILSIVYLIKSDIPFHTHEWYSEFVNSTTDSIVPFWQDGCAGCWKYPINLVFFWPLPLTELFHLILIIKFIVTCKTNDIVRVISQDKGYILFRQAINWSSVVSSCRLF